MARLLSLGRHALTAVRHHYVQITIQTALFRVKGYLPPPAMNFLFCSMRLMRKLRRAMSIALMHLSRRLTTRASDGIIMPVFGINLALRVGAQLTVASHVGDDDAFDFDAAVRFS